MKHRRSLALVLILLTTGWAVDSGDAAYQKDFAKWKAELVDDLKQNWLPLAGLFWLKPGENSFGSDRSNAVIFPKGPAHAGSFFLENGQVRVRFLPGIYAKMDGKSVSGSILQPDSSGASTKVELGSLEWHVIRRGQRVGVRLRDDESSAVKSYPGPNFFPINLAYRIQAKWIPSDGKKTVEVPNVLGDVSPETVSGRVDFEIRGQRLQLTDLGGDPAKGLFFVFNDQTAKTETYQGGRFLQTDPVKDGVVILDFNRAYNPPCAVTPFATCPLAPKENRLAVAIPAGEKYDHLHGHH